MSLKYSAAFPVSWIVIICHGNISLYDKNDKLLENYYNFSSSNLIRKNLITVYFNIILCFAHCKFEYCFYFYFILFIHWLIYSFHKYLKSNECSVGEVVNMRVGSPQNTYQGATHQYCFSKVEGRGVVKQVQTFMLWLVKKIQSNKTQGPHIFFFTLLVILGNYEPTCIVTIKMATM